jgi:predicted acetyltransferase
MTPATPSQSGGVDQPRAANGARPAVNQPLDRTHPRGSPPARKTAWQIVPGTPADHVTVSRFLTGCMQQPSTAEFQCQLEHPFYEPSNRLLLNKDLQLVGHLRLVPGQMWLQRQVVPVCWLHELVIRPEYRCRGGGSALLAKATEQMEQDGTILGLLRTDMPRFYAARGWVVCGRHSYAAAPPRAILSRLTARRAEQRPAPLPAISRPTAKKYRIRLWRHVEQEALARLYHQAEGPRCGQLVRTEPYWRWLIGRRAHDRIYVALAGGQHATLQQQIASIVAYAVVKQGRIVELIHDARHPQAADQLLGRACSDAIEQDVHRIQLEAPPWHLLHPLFAEAGGSCTRHEADRGEVFMVRLVKPRRLLQAMGTIFYHRARDAGLPAECELGLMLENARLRLRVGRDGTQLLCGKVGRSYLQCTAYQLTQLLLGHLDLPGAMDQGRIRASTQVAAQTAVALFPQLPWWFPPWDMLPVP